jgi:hypothetical protein
MGEIATDALALCVGLEGGAGRARMCVTKGQAVADEIKDSARVVADALDALGRVAEAAATIARYGLGQDP